MLNIFVPMSKIFVPSIINITIINAIMNNYYNVFNKINEKTTFHKSDFSL